MKARVIPNGVRDLSKGDRLRKLRRVIEASWVRSLVSLGMTALGSRRFKKALHASLIVGSCVILIWLSLPKPPLLDGIPFSQCVRDRNGKLLRVTLTSDQKFRIWTSLPEISPELIDATLRYEDKYFARHPGVNPIALLRSGYGLLHGG